MQLPLLDIPLLLRGQKKPAATGRIRRTICREVRERGRVDAGVVGDGVVKARQYLRRGRRTLGDHGHLDSRTVAGAGNAIGGDLSRVCHVGGCAAKEAKEAKRMGIAGDGVLCCVV